MNGKTHGLYTIMIHMRKQGTNINHRRFSCLLLIIFLLWALPGCGRNASAPEFPPTAETVQTMAEELHWTLKPEETESWAEDHILYALESEDQMRVFVSCVLAEGKRFLTEDCFVRISRNLLGRTGRRPSLWRRHCTAAFPRGSSMKPYPNRAYQNLKSRRQDPIRPQVRNTSDGKRSCQLGM